MLAAMVSHFVPERHVVGIQGLKASVAPRRLSEFDDFSCEFFGPFRTLRQWRHTAPPRESRFRRVLFQPGFRSLTCPRRAIMNKTQCFNV